MRATKKKKKKAEVEEAQEKLSEILETVVSMQENGQGQVVRLRSPEGMRLVLGVAWVQILVTPQQ